MLQGGGQECEGVAEIEASSVSGSTKSMSNRTLHRMRFQYLTKNWLQVFDLCQKNRALAVLFRRGRTPPLPESLKLNLGARKHSLEDEEESA